MFKPPILLPVEGQFSSLPVSTATGNKDGWCEMVSERENGRGKRKGVPRRSAGAGRGG